VLRFLVRRVAFAVGTIILTTFFVFGLMRFLRPEMYPGQSPFPDTFHDVERALLHLDFGPCILVGCKSTHQLWVWGRAVDLYLLVGGIASGLAFGVSGGLWCAARPRTRSARALEWLAMVVLCTPAYVLALLLLLLFSPFGVIHIPYFFEIHSYEPPLTNPWDFFRSMLVPWIACGLPIAGQFLRLTQAIALDHLHEDYVRTAYAKGVPANRVARRHAGPPTYVSVASLFGASAPIMVTNMALVEVVFALPGFFRHLRRALGQDPGLGDHFPHIPTLQAIAVWSAVLILAISLVADLAIVRLDPRIRAGHAAPPG
jgi:peptide/nickel transport system permease protein